MGDDNNQSHSSKFKESLDTEINADTDRKSEVISTETLVTINGRKKAAVQNIVANLWRECVELSLQGHQYYRLKLCHHPPTCHD